MNVDLIKIIIFIVIVGVSLIIVSLDILKRKKMIKDFKTEEDKKKNIINPDYPYDPDDPDDQKAYKAYKIELCKKFSDFLILSGFKENEFHFFMSYYIISPLCIYFYDNNQCIFGLSLDRNNISNIKFQFYVRISVSNKNFSSIPCNINLEVPEKNGAFENPLTCADLSKNPYMTAVVKFIKGFYNDHEAFYRLEDNLNKISNYIGKASSKNYKNSETIVINNEIKKLNNNMELVNPIRMEDKFKDNIRFINLLKDMNISGSLKNENTVKENQDMLSPELLVFADNIRNKFKCAHISPGTYDIKYNKDKRSFNLFLYADKITSSYFQYRIKFSEVNRIPIISPLYLVTNKKIYALGHCEDCLGYETFTNDKILLIIDMIQSISYPSLYSFLKFVDNMKVYENCNEKDKLLIYIAIKEMKSIYGEDNISTKVKMPAGGDNIVSRIMDMLKNDKS